MSDKKWVLITGASSGVGEACSKLLADKGFHVLAGVRSQDDGDRIQQVDPDRIFPLIIELRDQATIESAREDLKKMINGERLAALVNCAGMLHCGPLEYFPRELWFEQYDVNLFGAMALTSAMLPLLREGNGRVVNIGAVGGGIALPFYGAIASSKIAFEAVNDCLRRELHPWGIDVSIVEPGGIDTPANDKMRESVTRYLEQMDPVGKQRYGKSMETFSKWAYKKHKTNLKPEQVAKAVFKALKARRPKTRYRLGWDSRSVALGSKFLPDRLFDAIILKISALPIRFGAWRDQS